MTDWTDDFLIDLEPQRWQAPDGFPGSIAPAVFFKQDVANGLEIVLANAKARPTAADLRKAFDKRKNKRASPVLVVVGHPVDGGISISMCGPAGEQPSVYHDLDPSQVERIAETALHEPSHQAATRFLLATLPELDSDMPGLRNVGLLATQELRAGVPHRSDWEDARTKGGALLGRRGKELIQGLGFGVESLGINSSVLTVSGGHRSVAVFLDEGETFDAPARRFGTSPVSHALAIADQQGVPWVLLTRGAEIRLYAARADTGVGRKGRAETYVEANLSLLPADKAAYLHLLFSSEALAADGTIEQILDRSADFAAELAVRLRERVYFETVPTLARAVAARMAADPDEDDLAHAYEQVMIVLFRLLFVAYAEDKDLLPYRTNSKYADHSLSRIVRRIVDDRHAGTEEYDDVAADLWEDVNQLWRAVDKGQKAWGVPAYNGGLFSTDSDVNAAGAALSELELTDAEFGPALAAMLVDEGPEGIGPVDFRSLSVREFGTIYEGLLESQLSVAPSDLTVDGKGNYVPAKKKDEVLVDAGAVYFHNRSGARKDTGSYFTKPFAVEHLLDHALEPALTDHLRRLDELQESGDQAALASAFFDFKCADIAMGSGHFLVAAVDRIEARLSNWLSLNPIPSVTAELDRLRDAAYAALGDLGDGVEIETGSLLRRQVARRCVYGIDLNPVSVELGRLAIWIHTFVPGLPLSFLDHNLVCGDSLTGVGTLDEVVDALDPEAADGTISVFRQPIEDFLTGASKALGRLAMVSDADKSEIAEARKAHHDALVAVQPASDLFDLVCAARAGQGTLPTNLDRSALKRARANSDVGNAIKRLVPLHFPTVFPEVYRRSNPGFDCLLGNPPWEKVMADERSFWSLRFPGIRSLPVNKLNKEIGSLARQRPDLEAECENERLRMDQLRAALLAGPYRDLGRSHPDLYKAFCWRFLDLTRNGGRVGVVLPRSALSAAGSSTWREAVLESGTFSDVTFTTNTGGWVFDDAEHRYTIAFVSMVKSVDVQTVGVRGPFANMESFLAGVEREPVSMTSDEIMSWTSGAAFPMIETPEIARVFRKLRAHPRLDLHPHLSFRPVQGDLNATGGKSLMVFSDGDWPVYKGSSFNLWHPDTGDYYAEAIETVVCDALQARRIKSAKRANSGFSAFDRSYLADSHTLPCLNPRIAYRRIARATDTRTVIACLVPPQVVLTDKAAYLLNLPTSSGVPDATAEAYLLGALSSMILDWYARRVVEVQVDFHVIEAFPIPDGTKADRALVARVMNTAAKLAAADERYDVWAEAVGVKSGSVENEDERDSLIAELDAAVALLYGLDEADLEVIYTTFHRGNDYSERHAAVLEHFRRLK